MRILIRADIKRANNDLSGNAVMEFVNNMVSAFDAGFIDNNKITIAEIYQMAKNHVKDNYNMDVKPMRETWGEEIYLDCKKGSDLPS